MLHHMVLDLRVLSVVDVTRDVEEGGTESHVVLQNLNSNAVVGHYNKNMTR